MKTIRRAAALAAALALGCVEPPATCVPSDSGPPPVDAGLDLEQWDFVSRCRYVGEETSGDGAVVRVFDCTEAEICLPFEDYAFLCWAR